VSRVVLTSDELNEARKVGLLRQSEALKAGLKDKHGMSPADGERLHIQGAAGELVVSKFFGLPWAGSINTFKSVADLDEAIEIRTRTQHWHDLIVRADDDPDRVYILVTGAGPEFQVHGWIRGKDAQRPEWWKNHGGREWAWFVPSSSLDKRWS
jgi:hypothetical protein